MDLKQENIRKIRGLIVFTAFVMACVWKYDEIFRMISFIFHIFLPFILGGAIAFVLNVPMDFIERHLKTARMISLLIVLAVLIGIIALIMFVMIPQLLYTFTNIGISLQEFLSYIQKRILDSDINSSVVSQLAENMEIDGNQIIERIFQFLRNGAGNVLDSTVIFAKNFVSGAATCFIAFAFAVYILVQKEVLRVQSKKVLYAFVRKGRADAFVEVMALTYHTFSGFLTGQCVEALILGGMFMISMMIFKIPYALLIGILISFTALIPVFGAFIGCILGAFLIFVTNPSKALIFLILFIVLQQIEGNLIYPHIVGNSVGLPSIWVLAAVSLGGNLMGITGMLIFIPIMSVLYALFREIVYLKLKKAGIRKEDISYF